MKGQLRATVDKMGIEDFPRPRKGEDFFYANHCLKREKIEMLKNAIYNKILKFVFTQKVKNILKYVTIQILLLTIISCANQPDENNNFPSIEFNVNPDLLSLPLPIDNSFSIQMPSDWPEVDAQSFNAARQVINSDTSSYLKLELLKIFRSEQGASCVISKVVNETPLFDLLNTDFEKSLKLNFQTENVTKGKFSLNGNNTIQYRIINKDIVAFKLFCEINNNLYQIDYFIPNGVYDTEIRKVESSIGSINSNKNIKEVINKEKNLKEKGINTKKEKGG